MVKVPFFPKLFGLLRSQQLDSFFLIGMLRFHCFILRATRLSNKLLEQGYVKERLKSSLRKFYGRYGDLIKQYEVSLSQMLNDILWPDHIQWQPPTDQTLYRTRPFTEFWVVSIKHLRRVWHGDRGRLLLRTPGPVPLGLAYVLLVETNPFPNLSLFYRTLLFEYPSVLSRFCIQLWKNCSDILLKNSHTFQCTRLNYILYISIQISIIIYLMENPVLSLLNQQRIPPFCVSKN